MEDGNGNFGLGKVPEEVAWQGGDSSEEVVTGTLEARFWRKSLGMEVILWRSSFGMLVLMGHCLENCAADGMRILGRGGVRVWVPAACWDFPAACLEALSLRGDILSIRKLALPKAAQAGGAGRLQEAGKKRAASHFFSGAALFL